MSTKYSLLIAFERQVTFIMIYYIWSKHIENTLIIWWVPIYMMRHGFCFPSPTKRGCIKNLLSHNFMLLEDLWPWFRCEFGKNKLSPCSKSQSTFPQSPLVGATKQNLKGWFSIRFGLHGIPSLIHVSKSQYGGTIPTRKPQETIKIWFIFIKARFWLIYAKTSSDKCWELGRAIC